jgi:hypothetical protein
MERSDRLLLEHQINDLDGMIRQMTNMRSVLVRRTHRMLNATASAPARIHVPSSRPRVATFGSLRASASVPRPVARPAPAPVPPVPSVPLPVVNREFNIGGVNFNLNEMQNFAENPDVNGDVVRALLRMFDEEADDEIFVDYPAPAAHDQYVPPSVPVPVAPILKPKQKVLVLKKADLPRNMDDPCSICQESYKKIDNVKSNCGHNCCKDCMNRWVEAQHVARKRATCPMCREQLTLLTGFRERAKPRRKPMAVNVIEEGTEGSVREDEEDSDAMVVEA